MGTYRVIDIFTLTKCGPAGLQDWRVYALRIFQYSCQIAISKSHHLLLIASLANNYLGTTHSRPQNSEHLRKSKQPVKDASSLTFNHSPLMQRHTKFYEASSLLFFLLHAYMNSFLV